MELRAEEVFRPEHFPNTPIYHENLPFPTCPMNSG